MAQSIQNGASRAGALRGLAQALVVSGDQGNGKRVFEEAERVALSIQDDARRAEALPGLAQALATKAQYRRSLGILGARSLDEFLSFLATWYKNFNYFGSDSKLLYRELHVRVLKIIDWARVE